MLESGMVSDEEKRQDYYHTIHAESERLSRLIDNVLTLSQLEQHHYQVHMMSGDLRSVVSEAIAMLEPHARQHGFVIEKHFADTLPSLRFDRDAVIQIVINALDNSIKFSRQSEDKRIVVHLQPDGQGVELRIRDFGPGVPAAHQRHVFEAFYRGERELTRSSKGTGIGLALVQQLSAAMGATVEAANADERGFQLAIHFSPA
jgi:signal transduction histidine kinase